MEEKPGRIKDFGYGVNIIIYETVLEGKQGGYVAIHAKADQNKREQHIAAAMVLADKGHQVVLMPEDYSNQAILSQIRGSLKVDGDNQSIEEVWIIFNDRSLMRIPRKLSQHKDLYKLIKTF